MRVIAGTLGGRRLASPPGSGTRPTADRVREALFSLLGPIDGETLLDLFAGSGALGIEALSRGASRAVFVERDAAVGRVLERNLRELGIGPERGELRRGDARAALRRAASKGERYDLVFLDPPYREAAKWGPELAAALPAVLAEGGRVVAESDRRSPLALGLPALTERRYGDTSITIHSCT